MAPSDQQVLDSVLPRKCRNDQQAAQQVQGWLHRGQTDVVDAELADYFGSIPYMESMRSLV
jgi:RNA-directed DNA polymerase